ncbi:MAG: PAC2 family protein [Tepidiformaceae bacterium]
MDHLTVERIPELHDPVVVVAFAGWNDAASAATNAAKFIGARLGARRFAYCDPEPFFDFRSTRPMVRLDARGNREVTWPTNEFLYARNPVGPHDVVIALGVEPDLRWRTFTESYVSLFKQLNVSFSVSLGALMADVPHTRPTRVTGTALDPEVAERLHLTTSRYEGPTGIVGVLHQRLRTATIPGASLWANVPHYLTTNENPPATAALLDRLQVLLGMEFDLSELETKGERFVNEVNTAVGANPEIGEYVKRLEEAIDNAGDDELPPDRPLPPGQDVVLDVEAFLRSQRPPQ